MEKKTYSVEIVETLIYRLEVEATSEQEAEDLALASEAFSSNLHDDNDAVVNVKGIVEPSQA